MDVYVDNFRHSFYRSCARVSVVLSILINTTTGDRKCKTLALTCASSKPDRERLACKAATEAAVANTPTAAVSPATAGPTHAKKQTRD